MEILNSPFWACLLAVTVVSLISLIGIFTIGLQEKFLRNILKILIAFAAGSLFGDVFIHIIPETFEAIPAPWPGILILSGIIGFFLIEKFLLWQHCHELPDQKHHHPVGPMTIIGDGIHNFLDGILIAGSFLISTELGIATTIAVILHEIPQEIGNFATLLKAGYSKSKALLFNFLSALTAIFGALLVFILGQNIEGLSLYLLPFTAGSFIYIAGSDLIPMLHDREENSFRENFSQLIALIGGMGIMYLLIFLE